jgi:dephospho-CoA kinase
MTARVIGFAGKMAVGKTTAANFLCDYFGFVRVGFADPIRAMLKAANFCGEEELYGLAKETPIKWLGESPRFLLQTLGTEWGRMLVDQDIWCKLWFKQVTEILDSGTSVVVDDVRFPNEIEYLRRLDGRLVYITAATKKLVGPAGSRLHQSEHSINAKQADAEIVNDFTGAFLRRIDSFMHTI